MSTATLAPAPATSRPAWIGLALLLLRLALAGVFIAAAIPKIAAPDLFAGNIYNYHMLPAWGVNTLAIVLPWIELFTGVCLALGIWRRASATIMAGLMVVFIVAFAAAKARGLDISCGCFEVGTEAKPSSLLWVALRDLALLAAALVLVRYDTGPRPLDLVLHKSRHAATTAR